MNLIYDSVYSSFGNTDASTSNFSSKGERTNVLSSFCYCGIKCGGNKHSKLKGFANEET